MLWRRQRLIRADAQSVDVRAFDLAQSVADLADRDRGPFANRFEHPQSRARAASESDRLLIPTVARTLLFRGLQFHSRTKSRGMVGRAAVASYPCPYHGSFGPKLPVNRINANEEEKISQPRRIRNQRIRVSSARWASFTSQRGLISLPPRAYGRDRLTHST